VANTAGGGTIANEGPSTGRLAQGRLYNRVVMTALREYAARILFYYPIHFHPYSILLPHPSPSVFHPTPAVFHDPSCDTGCVPSNSIWATLPSHMTRRLRFLFGFRFLNFIKVFPPSSSDWVCSQLRHFCHFCKSSPPSTSHL
jgi:hypothetical protein